MVYRLIFQSGPGKVDTGANYDGCSRDNPGACRPIQFASVDEAKQYAVNAGETPVIVQSVEEAWGIVGGTVQPNLGTDWTTYAIYGALAYAAWKVLG